MQIYSAWARVGSVSEAFRGQCGKYGAHVRHQRTKLGLGSAPLARDLSPAGQHLETVPISICRRPRAVPLRFQRARGLFKSGCLYGRGDQDLQKWPSRADETSASDYVLPHPRHQPAHQVHKVAIKHDINYTCIHFASTR